MRIIQLSAQHSSATPVVLSRLLPADCQTTLKVKDDLATKAGASMGSQQLIKQSSQDRDIACVCVR